MKEIMGCSLLILTLFLMLRILLTFLLDKLYLKANKKEFKLSILLMTICEVLILVSSLLNLTNKSFVLFYILFILMILMLVSSMIFNLLLINKYLLVTSLINLVVSLWAIVDLGETNIYYNYLKTLLLSPLSNKNNVNYSFIIITSVIILLVTVTNNIIKYVKNKKRI